MDSPTIVIDLHFPGLPIVFKHLRDEVKVIFIQVSFPNEANRFGCNPCQLIYRQSLMKKPTSVLLRQEYRRLLQKYYILGGHVGKLGSMSSLPVQLERVTLLRAVVIVTQEDIGRVVTVLDEGGE